MSRFIPGAPVLANASNLEPIVTSDGQHAVSLDGQVIAVLSDVGGQLVWTSLNVTGLPQSPVQYAIYRGDGASPSYYYKIAQVTGNTYADLATVDHIENYYVVPMYEGTVPGIASNIVQILVSLP